MTKNFHDTPFDEGTRVKLGLFRDYVTAWLPVWLQKAQAGETITIADLFAGPGRDCRGVPGSPLIALDVLKKFESMLDSCPASVELLLNEASRDKAQLLTAAMNEERVDPDRCRWKVTQYPFDEALDRMRSRLRTGPSLLFLDQQGMKEISDSVFRQVLSLPRTDLLFFIASSFVRRFATHPYFQKHIPFPEGLITSSAFNNTHRVVTQYYRDLAKDVNRDVFIGKYSIKKGSNIYGLVFGSGHPLGRPKDTAVLEHWRYWVMAESRIEWTDVTWNPTTGCTKISAGCKNCYAERMSNRLRSMNVEKYEAGFTLTTHESALDIPRRWTRPRTVFVNSMSDLFHRDVPTEFIHRVFEVMVTCPAHRFQVLTKRAHRVKLMSPRLPWSPNIWMGVSVEDRRQLPRVDALRGTGAAVKFLSLEPLIGPLEDLDLRRIDWVIVGGESGPRARPMSPGWVTDIRDRCRQESVPFFFKQWGGPNKKKTGRVLDGRTHDEMPESLRCVAGA